MTTDRFTSDADLIVSSRFNLYQAVHKGMRAFMVDTLVRVGHIDAADWQECMDCAEQVHTLLHVCGEHVAHENRFIHPVMERHAPGSAGHAESDHADHLAGISALRARLALATSASPQERDAHWLGLYHEMSHFVAENLAHMLLEEHSHNAVLWQHLSDQELVALHDELVASIPPDEMAVHFRWILPSVSHAERVGMLQGMRQGMPPEVFASQLDMARPLLQARDWLKLKAAFQGELAVPQEMLA